MGDFITDSQWESFFELVRENDCLYDLSNPFYHDTPYLNNVWTSIAEKMDMKDIDGEYILILYEVLYLYRYVFIFLYKLAEETCIRKVICIWLQWL